MILTWFFLIIKDSHNNHFIINRQLLRGIHNLHRDADFACMEHVCRATGGFTHLDHIATSLFNSPLWHAHVYSHSKSCYSKVADTKPWGFLPSQKHYPRYCDVEEYELYFIKNPPHLSIKARIKSFFWKALVIRERLGSSKPFPGSLLLGTLPISPNGRKHSSSARQFLSTFQAKWLNLGSKSNCKASPRALKC